MTKKIRRIRAKPTPRQEAQRHWRFAMGRISAYHGGLRSLAADLDVPLPKGFFEFREELLRQNDAVAAKANVLVPKRNPR